MKNYIEQMNVFTKKYSYGLKFDSRIFSTALVFTACDANETAGVAYAGSLCTESSISVIKRTPFLIQTTAHELGHILSSSHIYNGSIFNIMNPGSSKKYNNVMYFDKQAKNDICGFLRKILAKIETDVSFKEGCLLKLNVLSLAFKAWPMGWLILVY